MRARRAILGAVVVCAAAGCASILGIDYGMPYPDGGADGTAADGAMDDALVDVREAAPIPDVNVEANSATCDDFTRVLEDGGVYLSPTGSDSNPCTPASPCRSLNKANLVTAATRGKPIYLLAGDYPYALDMDLIGQDAGLVVEGGWRLDGGAWDPVCDFNEAVIHGAKSILRGHTAAYVSQNSTLTLRLVSVEADPGSGTSYGLFANQSMAVTLEGVAVRAGNGAMGGPGNPGMGSGAYNCVAGNAAMGGPGDPGSAVAGSYDPLGYNPKPSAFGGVGEAGGGGGAGQPGMPGDCPTCTSGFDGGPFCVGSSSMTSGGMGQPGCGGGGGNGGVGGDGAHGSIAVFVTGNGTLVLKSGTKLATTPGSAGGNGGTGANGAVGMAGPSGQPATGTNCSGGFCIGAMAPCADGGAGGSPGGTGGKGGTGGGGMGGPSVTMVRQSSVKANVYDASIFGFNAGGDGGQPNGLVGDQQPEIVF